MQLGYMLACLTVLLRHVPLRVSDEATTVSRLPGSVCEPKQFVSCRLTLMDLPGGPERTSHGQFITLSIHCTGASQRTSHVYPPTCCRNLSVYEIITITISMIIHHSVHVYPPINHTKPSRRMLETETKALRPRPLLWPRDRRRPTFRPTDWSRDQTHGLWTEPIRLVSRLWLLCLPRAIIWNNHDRNNSSVVMRHCCSWFTRIPSHLNSSWDRQADRQWRCHRSLPD